MCIRDRSTGGLFWFVDLRQPDASWALPFANLCVITFNLATSFPRTALWRPVWMGMTLMVAGITPLIYQLPAGVFVYWLSSSSLALSQRALLRVPAVRGWILNQPGVAVAAPAVRRQAASSSDPQVAMVQRIVNSHMAHNAGLPPAQQLSTRNLIPNIQKELQVQKSRGELTSPFRIGIRKDPSGEQPDQITVKVVQDLNLEIVNEVVSRMTQARAVSQELADEVNLELRKLRSEGKLAVGVHIKLETKKDGSLGFILQIEQ
eukprot:TRINITY_DN50066_c0_g1_i1.p1 TRINITY_DN50066_c0_g1~~TRINITY_DN50066_c0_g1_i1.p1  ORF type:complete len:299 (-),score=64.10 TRINITY_DN50066_c0_g1_i1:128-913(-)